MPKNTLIYLDNSATTYPKPVGVRQAVFHCVTNLGANPGRGGYPMAQRSANAIYGVRKKVAEFFGAKGAESIVFTKSCTESLNTVIFSSLQKGDHAVISDLEHNAVFRPMKHLEEKGVELTVFKTYEDNDKTVNSLRAALKENTKLVVCTAASNAFGTGLPIARLGALCHIYGIDFCVDAAQAAGIIPIDMAQDNIDFLCVPAHKGLYGIMGAGILICGKSLNPLIFGGTGTNSLSHLQPELLPERLESGTLNVAGIMSIGAGIDFVNKIGVKNLARVEHSKILWVYTALAKMKKVQLYTNVPRIDKQVPVLSFNIIGRHCEQVSEALAKKGIAVRAGLHCAPLAHQKYGTEDGTIRLSPSVFTTARELQFLVKQIELIVN